MTDPATTTSTSPSADPAATVALAPTVTQVLDALHRLGTATAAATAAATGLGYSTTTKKLRILESRGFAEPIHADDGRAQWRLTDDGRTRAQQTADVPDPAGTPAVPEATVPEAAVPEATVPAPVGAGAPTSGDHGCPERTAGAREGLDQAPTPPEVPADPVAVGEDTTGPTAPTGAEDATAALAPATRTADTDGPLDPGAGRVGTDATGPDVATSADVGPATVHADPPPVAKSAEPAGTRPASGNRRASGTLRGAILDLLEANPTQHYRTGDLCRLIDRAQEGTGAKKASPGAVHNAAVKLVEAGQAQQVVDRPATFALTVTGDASTTT